MDKNRINWSYLAGFLDGDGSIYVQLKPNETYKFHYQISCTVAFFQSVKTRKTLERLQKKFKFGYLRFRKDGIVEWIVGDEAGIKELLKNVSPFLEFKQEQAKLMILILEKKSKVENKKDFINLVKLIEKFRYLNYSKTRKFRKIY